MGYDQEQAAYPSHQWKFYNNKNRTLPSFSFPTPPHHVSTPSSTHSTSTTTMNGLTTLVEDVLTTLTTKTDTTTTESPITTTNQITDVLNNTFNDIVSATPNNTLIFDEATNSNNSIIVGVTEGTSNSSFTEMMQNGSFPIEVTQNGPDLTEVTGNNNTILTTISEIITSTAENTVSILSTSTEKAITYVTESVNNISISTTAKTESESDGHFMPHYHNMETHHLLYIILFIIIAILLLIGIILLLIYIRYRKHSFHALRNYYEVSPMNENKNSSSIVEQEEQKECSNDLYVQYPC